MIDTNIIEKEYDKRQSECNFVGEGGGQTAAEGLSAARITLTIIKGGKTRGERGARVESILLIEISRHFNSFFFPSRSKRPA